MTTHCFVQLADQGFGYGHSADVQSLIIMASEIAPTDIPVLLVGQSGNGKEVYARLIHRLSGSRGMRRKVSCAPMDAGRLLAEVRELSRKKVGGDDAPRTVFLDGVQDLEVACQSVLISLLPDGEPYSIHGS
jgi:Nif-specific regulatory protein